MNDPNRDTDPSRAKEPNSAGHVKIFVPLMILCCAAPVIIASGALAGFFAWLSGNGTAAIGLAIVAGAVAVSIYKSKLVRKHNNRTPDPITRDR